MKNAVTLKRFRDRITKEIYEEGQIISLSDERYEELKKKGWIKFSRKKPATKE